MFQKVVGTILTLAKSGGDMSHPSHPQITPMLSAHYYILLSIATYTKFNKIMLAFGDSLAIFVIDVLSRTSKTLFLLPLQKIKR